MNNNDVESQENSNSYSSSLAATSSSSSSAMPKNTPVANGTLNTDLGPFYRNDATVASNSAAAVPSSSSTEHPCNTCQRSGSNMSSTSQSDFTPLHGINAQPSSSHVSNCSDGNLRHFSTPTLPIDEDDADGVDSDDQYCVYTYKGDGSQHPSRLAADLPSSFFKLHPSDSSCPSSLSSSGVPHLEPSCSHSARPGSRIPNGSAHPAHPSENNNAMYSPDMDFLEMDFDPGGSGDGCCDGDDEDEEDIVRDHLHLGGPSSSGVSANYNRNNDLMAAATTTADVTFGSGNNNNMLNDDHTSAAAVLSKLVVTRSNGGGCFASPETDTAVKLNEPLPHCSMRTTTLLDCSARGSSASASIPNKLLNPASSSVNRTDEIKLRIVKSVTLPEMGASKCSPVQYYSGVASCAGSSHNRAMAMSMSAPVFQDKMDGPYPTVIPAGKSSENSVELEVDGVMIWSIQEAREISVNQIGRSACGATACLNVLSALGCIMTTLSPEFVNNCVGTRVRAEDADLPEYLLSRSVAGATHEDLIAGIHRASNGLIYGRFFQPKQDASPSTLNKWLLHWICKGAVPIATLNLQVRRPGDSSSEIPDSWHHQMVFGVTEHGVFLTNPLECVPMAELIPQLSSPSVLLVRRDDVTRRKGPRTDLRKLARFFDTRWNEMNVLGQVSNMLLEEMPVLNGQAGLARRIRTTHISIPAEYKAGITLFIRESNSTSCALLKAAPEL